MLVLVFIYYGKRSASIVCFPRKEDKITKHAGNSAGLYTIRLSLNKLNDYKLENKVSGDILITDTSSQRDKATVTVDLFIEQLQHVLTDINR